MAQHYTKDAPLKVFEAFAGIGTQRMALRNLKIPHEVVAISEIDAHADKSYQAIHGPTLNLGDISQIGIEDIPEHDLFTYSFPCTSISQIGKKDSFKKGSGTESSLLWECERVIKKVRPKYLLMENVKAIQNKTNLRYLKEWIHLLERYGYKSQGMVLNAVDFGIPQNRERYFLVSILGEQPQIELSKGHTAQALHTIIEGKYRTDLEINPRIKERWLANDKFISGLQSMDTQDIGTFYYTESNRFFTKIKMNTSRTIKAKNNDISLVYPDHYMRRMSPIETWRLMGVSDEDFYKAQGVCSNTHLYKQVGNAIVVQVLEALFSQLNLVSE